MRQYIVSKNTPEGEVDFTVRCDYDLAAVLNDSSKLYAPMLIGVKPSRGGMKWYLGGMLVEDIRMFREDVEYAGGGN